MQPFFRGVAWPTDLHPTPSLEKCFRNHHLLVCALPSHAVRTVFHRARPYVEKNTLIVSATKGLDEETYQTVSQVLMEGFASESGVRVACLSGPSFAGEVSRKLPTAVAAAGSDPEAARCVQEVFARPYFRVYSNPDLIGVELGGAMKNVMAIAAGVSDGLGLGHSSRGAHHPRAGRDDPVGVSLGAQAETFSGLAGLGDLVLTCTGDLSRNRRVGLELGRGRKISEILEGMRMVAEGVRTTKVMRELARRRGVEMPITEKMHEILYGEKNPAKAVDELIREIAVGSATTSGSLEILRRRQNREWEIRPVSGYFVLFRGVTSSRRAIGSIVSSGPCSFQANPLEWVPGNRIASFVRIKRSCQGRTASMPIYEYRCQECGRVSSFIVMNTRDPYHPHCKRCQSGKMTKLISRVARVRSEEPSGGPGRAQQTGRPGRERPGLDGSLDEADGQGDGRRHGGGLGRHGGPSHGGGDGRTRRETGEGRRRTITRAPITSAKFQRRPNN